MSHSTGFDAPALNTWKIHRERGELAEINEDLVFEILLLVKKYQETHCMDKAILITMTICSETARSGLQERPSEISCRLCRFSTHAGTTRRESLSAGSENSLRSIGVYKPVLICYNNL